MSDPQIEGGKIRSLVLSSGGPRAFPAVTTCLEMLIVQKKIEVEQHKKRAWNVGWRRCCSRNSDWDDDFGVTTGMCGGISPRLGRKLSLFKSVCVFWRGISRKHT